MFRVLRFALPFALISVLGDAQSVSPPAGAKDSAPAQSGVSPAKVVEGSAGSSSKDTAAPVAPLDNPLGEARLLYRQGNFHGAFAKYEQVMEQHPQSPDGYAGLVRVYLKQKDVEQAMQTAESGIAHSDSPRMRSARAEVWFRQGKIQEAEKEWVGIINSGYPEARAYLGLARIRDAIAMYKTAKALIDKAHDLDPKDSDIQEAWVGTLSRAERIKYLEDSLAGENNWDAEEHEGAKDYLAYMKERANQHKESCRLVSKVTATETPLVRLLIDPSHLHGYGLSVALNGHKSKLLLDTGASGILISRSIAEHAGISKISQTKVWGVGDKGRRNAYFGVADSIKVGELEFQDCPVEVIEQRSVVDDDGLIGADVFEDFLVEIDFPNEKLKLSQLPKRPGEVQQNLALTREDDDQDDSDSPEPKADAKPGDSKAPDAKTPDAKTSAPASSPARPLHRP